MFERIKSNIRFSLTMRIALRYALFLFASTFSILFIFTLVYIVSVALPHVQEARDIISRYETREAYAGTDIMSVKVVDTTGVVVHDEPPYADFEFIQYYNDSLYVSVSHNMPEGTVFRFTVKASAYTLQYSMLAWAIIGANLLRIISLLTRRKKLGGSIIKPIHEMTETARNLSASNLDMRINILGTKNELRDLASVINEMLDRIELAYESQKAFVSDASHELRTPIAVIQGYARLLERWGTSDPEVSAEAIAAISGEADSMKGLVEQLLFLARHDKKTFKLECELFDLSELCEELVRDTRLIDENHSISLGINSKVVVNADRGAVKQALRIFADNAKKYTPAGGEISISCEDMGDEARVSISDNGPGMTREEARRAFDRFYRSESARISKQQGHGLGLSIARLIASSHGGRISVKTAPGEGSTFRLILKK